MDAYDRSVGYEPDAGSAAAQAQAAREAATVPVNVPSASWASDRRDATLRLEVLRLAQAVGSPSDPGHPASPDEVRDRANTYWEWMTK